MSSPPTENPSPKPTPSTRTPSTPAPSKRTPSKRTWYNEAMRIVLPMVILGAGVAGFAAIGQKESPPRSKQETTLPAVDTVTVEDHNIGLDIDVDGTVVPYREINVSSEVAGKIIAKAEACEPGRVVEAGTLLVEIDTRKYELDVERLQKELAQSKVELDELDVQLENTADLIKLAKEELALRTTQLARAERLEERTATLKASVEDAWQAELTSRKSLATLENELRSTKTRRSRLQQGVELINVRLEQSQLDLAHTKITAPVSGVIVTEQVEEGSFAQIGSQLFSIEDTSAVEVICHLRMDELAWVLRQQGAAGSEDAPLDPQDDYRLPKTPVTVAYRLGEHEYSWEGVLDRYDGIGFDEQTRTIPCRVHVPDPRKIMVDGSRSGDRYGPRALVRGMFVTITIHTDPAQPLLRLPEQALQPGNVVWKYDDGKLVIVKARVARITDDTALLEATGQLAAGDEVIVSPLTVVEDEMPIRKVNESTNETPQERPAGQQAQDDADIDRAQDGDRAEDRS